MELSIVRERLRLNRVTLNQVRKTFVNPAAIAKALQGSSNLLSTKIVVNPAAPSVFRSEFGNFDQFLNTLDGHTAHDIIMALQNR